LPDYLGKNVKKNAEKMPQMSPFLGYIIVSRNHNELPKVAQLMKNFPIRFP
jgi:hypothetical protein